MKKKGKDSGAPPAKAVRAEELDGASSYRSFRGALAPRAPREPRKTEKGVRPAKGELSPEE
jgi:hypothetical protein